MNTKVTFKKNNTQYVVVVQRNENGHNFDIKNTIEKLIHQDENL